MKITNELVKESFCFETMNKGLSVRQEELEKLDDVLRFCKSIDEKVCYDARIWEVEVEADVTLYQYLFEQQSDDTKAFVLDMLTKRSEEKQEEGTTVIFCSCGVFGGAADDLICYAKYRQEYLKGMSDYKEYTQFMRSCFPNSQFSEECDNEFAYITDFEKHAKEITTCLSVLDEYAISLYEEHRTNLKEAMKILEAMIHRKCSGDSKHKKELQFPFLYEIEEMGTLVQKERIIECEPHLKLIRPDSNLRIYFSWKDDVVGDGKKVLIGRVGRHPWKK